MLRRVLTVAVVLMTCASAPVAPSADERDHLSFEERFALEGPLAPTFTRPEVIELLSSLQPETSGDITSAEDLLEKRLVQVLRDLLNTPVEELLISRAEAGPDVPPPPATSDVALTLNGQIDRSLVDRPANHLLERAPAESLASLERSATAPTAVEHQPARLQSQTEAHEPPKQEIDRLRDLAAAPDRLSPITGAPNARPAIEQRLGRGRAAWYQHPGRTASGEKFNPNRLTAAHRTLPFGTRVLVLNEATGRSTVVRINDRVPRKAKLVIDLSRASAKAIGLLGVGRVSLYRLNALPKS